MSQEIGRVCEGNREKYLVLENSTSLVSQFQEGNGSCELRCQ